MSTNPRSSSSLASHFNSPRNAGRMEDPDATGKASADGRPPYFEIYLKTDGQVVKKAAFTVFGCGYSIAACSALTELITGRPISECRSVAPAQVIEALDGMPEEKRYCARLAVEALRDAISNLGKAPQNREVQ
ncbi:MAG: iron-sulfur cluster assembly scaffold protein [Thermoguttaceae bacterium]